VLCVLGFNQENIKRCKELYFAATTITSDYRTGH